MMNWDTLPSGLDIDSDTLIKLAIRAFMLKTLCKFERKNAPELEQMTEKDIKLLNDKKLVYDRLADNFPLHTGKELSRNERYDKNWVSTSFTYGEIDFKAFAEIIYLIKKKYGDLLRPGCLFYDLGSGFGKGVIAAALCHDFSVCKGIEMLESLHDVSIKMKSVYDQYTVMGDLSEINIQKEEGQNQRIEKEQSIISNEKEIEDRNEGRNYRAEKIDWDDREFNKTPEVVFECGDILEKSWDNGNLIFANSTCFDSFLMWRIAKKAKLLPKNSLFVTLTKRLPDYLNWDLLENYQCIMSWGDATVYIHCKRHDPTEQDIEAAMIASKEEDEKQFKLEQEAQQNEEDRPEPEGEDDKLFADSKMPK